MNDVFAVSRHSFGNRGYHGSDAEGGSHGKCRRVHK